MHYFGILRRASPLVALDWVFLGIPVSSFYGENGLLAVLGEGRGQQPQESTDLFWIAILE